MTDPQPMPFVPILLALRAEVSAALVDTTLGGKAITVRHARFRQTKSAERPCVAIVVVATGDIAQLGEQTASDGTPEQLMEMQINLSIDADLEPEEDDVASLDGDPTGFADISVVMAAILDRLLPDLEIDPVPNTLGGLVWQIRYDGSVPEPGDVTSDLARLEERLTLIYRVRADHPTTLLTET